MKDFVTEKEVRHSLNLLPGASKKILFLSTLHSFNRNCDETLDLRKQKRKNPKLKREKRERGGKRESCDPFIENVSTETALSFVFT